MAYKIVRQTTDAQSGVEIKAILDSAADLDTLGTNYSPGSLAVVADKDTPMYMLNASKQWKEI